MKPFEAQERKLLKSIYPRADIKGYTVHFGNNTDDLVKVVKNCHQWYVAAHRYSLCEHLLNALHITSLPPVPSRYADTEMLFTQIAYGRNYITDQILISRIGIDVTSKEKTQENLTYILAREVISPVATATISYTRVNLAEGKRHPVVEAYEHAARMARITT